MVYTLAATRRRCRRLRLGTLADDTGTTNKTTYRLHFEHWKITLRLYDVYCKLCSKSEQFGDVHEFVLLHQCLLLHVALVLRLFTLTPLANIPTPLVTPSHFRLTSFGWLPSITLTLPYSIICYGTVNFDLRLIYLRPLLQEQNWRKVCVASKKKWGTIKPMNI